MISGRIVGSILALLTLSCGRSGKEADSPSGNIVTKIPVVAVAQVTRENLRREIVFDAEFRPSQDVELHARVAGFVRKMQADVGDRVTEGQVIGVSFAPHIPSPQRGLAFVHPGSFESTLGLRNRGT